jgi:hypothetical protein
MNWIGIIQVVLVIAATGVSARDSKATRTLGMPARRAVQPRLSVKVSLRNAPQIRHYERFAQRTVGVNE